MAAQVGRAALQAGIEAHIGGVDRDEERGDIPRVPSEEIPQEDPATLAALDRIQGVFSSALCCFTNKQIMHVEIYTRSFASLTLAVGSAVGFAIGNPQLGWVCVGALALTLPSIALIGRFGDVLKTIDQVERMREVNAALREITSRAQNAARIARESALAIQAENVRLSASIDSLSETERRLGTNITTFEERIAELETVKDALSERNRELSETVESMRVEIQRLRDAASSVGDAADRVSAGSDAVNQLALTLRRERARIVEQSALIDDLRGRVRPLRDLEQQIERQEALLRERDATIEGLRQRLTVE